MLKAWIVQDFFKHVVLIDDDILACLMKLAIQFLNAVVELLIMVLLPEIVMSKENVFKMLALSYLVRKQKGHR